MNAHRMDQETVERLLGGPVVDPRPGQEPLVALLSAVRAAPRPGELSGETAAVHAFRRARAGSPLPVPDHGGRPRALVRLAGLKVALAGLAVAATGGVALAAATDTLPAPLHRPDDRPANPATAAPDRTGAPARPRPPGSPSGVDEGDSPRPDESLVGLCRAFRAGAGDNPGRALDNPIFGDLISGAGGRDGVAGYCERVLAERDPRRSGEPRAGRPGSAPTDRPTGPPTGTPKGRRATPATSDTPTTPGATDGGGTVPTTGAATATPHTGPPSGRPSPR